jgi:hypothetical protein
MAVFDIQFEDPLREVTGGVGVKSNWDPGSWGSVSVTKTELTITGSSRLSPVERVFSAGVLGQIFVKTFFQSLRHRTRHIPTADILKVLAATKPTPPKFITGPYDIIHVFVEQEDGRRDILSFSFFNPLKLLGSRPALWLFWGFLTRILPSDKLELQTQALREEVGLETRGWEQEEMQSRIAAAFFKALPLVIPNIEVGMPGRQIASAMRLFAQAGDVYKEVFGMTGRQVALTMLSAEDWRIRAAAASCLSKIGEPSDMDILLHLLEDQHPFIRVATAQSLLDSSPEKAYQALQLASQDEDRGVRRAAQDALNKVTKQRLPR